MTTEEKAYIRKIQSTLQQIQNKTNVFFNTVQYERLGLITIKNKWVENKAGVKVKDGVSYHLTEKSEKYLKLVI